MQVLPRKSSFLRCDESFHQSRSAEFVGSCRWNPPGRCCCHDASHSGSQNHILGLFGIEEGTNGHTVHQIEFVVALTDQIGISFLEEGLFQMAEPTSPRCPATYIFAFFHLVLLLVQFLTRCSLRTNFMSCAAMMRTSSGNEVLVGFQPSRVRALVGRPTVVPLLAGRKYLASTSTSTLPVAVSIPFSSTPRLPSARWCLLLWRPGGKPRTVWYSPVAITKSSGTSCCRMSHMHST